LRKRTTNKWANDWRTAPHDSERSHNNRQPFWSEDVCADSVAASCHTSASGTLDGASHNHCHAVLSDSNDQASDLEPEYACQEDGFQVEQLVPLAPLILRLVGCGGVLLIEQDTKILDPTLCSTIVWIWKY
jgi:hypothetical protein